MRRRERYEFTRGRRTQSIRHKGAWARGSDPGEGVDNLLVNDSGDARLINDASDVLQIKD